MIHQSAPPWLIVGPRKTMRHRRRLPPWDLSWNSEAWDSTVYNTMNADSTWLFPIEYDGIIWDMVSAAWSAGRFIKYKNVLDISWPTSPYFREDDSSTSHLSQAFQLDVLRGSWGPGGSFHFFFPDSWLKSAEFLKQKGNPCCQEPCLSP